jgi:hypothetical protein
MQLLYHATVILLAWWICGKITSPTTIWDAAHWSYLKRVNVKSLFRIIISSDALLMSHLCLCISGVHVSSDRSRNPVRTRWFLAVPTHYIQLRPATQLDWPGYYPALGLASRNRAGLARLWTGATFGPPDPISARNKGSILEHKWALSMHLSFCINSLSLSQQRLRQNGAIRLTLSLQYRTVPDYQWWSKCFRVNSRAPQFHPNSDGEP